MINDAIFNPDARPIRHNVLAPSSQTMSRASVLGNAGLTVIENPLLTRQDQTNSRNARESSHTTRTDLGNVGPLETVGAVVPINGKDKNLDFEKMLGLMQRSAIIYNSDSAAIREQFPNTGPIVTLYDSGIKFALEEDQNLGEQLLTIRGTDNTKNKMQDLEYAFTYNRELGIYAHKGFSDDAKAVFEYLKSNDMISKDKPIAITGHSLGGAIANLLLCHLHKEGYKILPSTTFGQPKVTNGKGVHAFGDIDLTRVVYENDIVPFVPPTTLITRWHGPYQHMGAEVILLDDNKYCYLDAHDEKRKSATSFWKNVFHESFSDHKIERYVSSLESKQFCAEEVPYEKREAYIHPVKRVMNMLPCCDC